MAKVKKKQKGSKVYRVVSAFLTDIYESSVWKLATVGLVASISMLSWYMSIPDVLTSTTKQLNDKKQYLEEMRVASEYAKKHRELLFRFSSALQRETEAMNNFTSRKPGDPKRNEDIKSLLETYHDEVDLKGDVKQLTAEMKGLKFYSADAELVNSDVATDIELSEIFLTHLEYVEKELEALKSNDIDRYVKVHTEDIENLPELAVRMTTNAQKSRSYLLGLGGLVNRLTAEAEAAERDSEMLDVKILLFNLAGIYTALYMVFALIKLQRTWVATK